MAAWKRYGAAFLLNAALTVVVLCLRGFDLKIYYVDAFSVAGSVSVFLALFGKVVRAGAFDTIGYGFSTLRSDRKDKDLYEYVSRKKEKRGRKSGAFLPLLTAGFGFIAVSLLVSAV